MLSMGEPTLYRRLNFGQIPSKLSFRPRLFPLAALK